MSARTFTKSCNIDKFQGFGHKTYLFGSHHSTHYTKEPCLSTWEQQTSRTRVSGNAALCHLYVAGLEMGTLVGVSATMRMTLWHLTVCLVYRKCSIYIFD